MAKPQCAWGKAVDIRSAYSVTLRKGKRFVHLWYCSIQLREERSLDWSRAEGRLSLTPMQDLDSAWPQGILPSCHPISQGALFLNDRQCKIVQRHLEFDGGIAYGIDCLLMDPSLGGRCDSFFTVDFMVSPLFWSPTLAQGPNPILTEARATLTAALALLKLSPSTSGWHHPPPWLELRLTSAAQWLKITQQKSCIHTKPHTG